MEAMRTPRRVWVWLLVPLVGCVAPTAPPAAHQERAEPAREKLAEPPQVVETPEAGQAQLTGESDVESGVLEYIARVDDAQARAQRRAAWQPYAPGPAREVADAGPAVVVPPQAEADVPVAGPVVPGGHAVPPGAGPSSESPAGPAPLAAASRPAADGPPVPGSVVVRAATDVHARLPAAEAPGVNQAAEARGTVPTSLREFLAQVVPAEDASFREQLDLRVLRLVAGDYAGAREPLALVTPEQQELAGRFVEALIVLREAQTGDPAAAAAAAARALAEAQEAVGRLGDLSVPALRICSAVRSFGQYDEMPAPRFVAGRVAEFVLYCEVAGFASELRDDGYYHTVFDLTTTILSRAGDTVLELHDPGLVDRCRNRRRDCFIPRLVRLPATLSPGQYVAKVTVADKLAGKVAESRVAFEVVARP